MQERSITECSLVEACNKGTNKCYPFLKKSFQFLVLVSSISFMYYYYYSGFPFFFYYNLQFSTLVFPLFAQVLDRKYMFLICNAILVFLAKNVKFSHSTLNYSAEDGMAPPEVKEAIAQENIASSMEYAGDPPDVAAVEEVEMEDEQKQEDHRDLHGGNKTTGFVLYSPNWEYDDDDEGEEPDQDGVVEATEQVSDARVSTEELNKKFEEFIRKMKEEIRVEAQQPLITV